MEVKRIEKKQLTNMLMYTNTGYRIYFFMFVNVFLLNWQDKPVGSHEDKTMEKRKVASRHILSPGPGVLFTATS